MLILENIHPNKKFNLEYWLLKGKEHKAIEIENLEKLDLEKLKKLAQEKLPKIISDYQNEKIPIIAFPEENIISPYDDYFHLARRDKRL